MSIYVRFGSSGKRQFLACDKLWFESQLKIRYENLVSICASHASCGGYPVGYTHKHIYT